MLEENIPKEGLQSLEYVEEEDEETMPEELVQLYEKHKEEAEILDLQNQLRKMMEFLGVTYGVPYQSNVQKADSLNDMTVHAYLVNTFQPTSYTYKFFHLLTCVICGFVLDWLRYTPPYLVTATLGGLLLGSFPIRNVIFLSKPTKRICENCKLIESFIGKENPVYTEDFIKMKKLKKYGKFLCVMVPLCFILNLALTYGTIFGTAHLYRYFYPHTLVPESVTFSILFIPYVIAFSMCLGVYLKFKFVRWMIRKQLSPRIVGWIL